MPRASSHYGTDFTGGKSAGAVDVTRDCLLCVRVWIPAWCCALLPTPLCEPRSPLRGEFKYSYDWGRETWLCTTDGHLLLDLLTRDLIYCCNGFPKF